MLTAMSKKRFLHGDQSFHFERELHKEEAINSKEQDEKAADVSGHKSDIAGDFTAGFRVFACTPSPVFLHTLIVV